MNGRVALVAGHHRLERRFTGRARYAVRAQGHHQRLLLPAGLGGPWLGRRARRRPVIAVVDRHDEGVGVAGRLGAEGFFHGPNPVAVVPGGAAGVGGVDHERRAGECVVRLGRLSGHRALQRPRAAVPATGRLVGVAGLLHQGHAEALEPHGDAAQCGRRQRPGAVTDARRGQGPVDGRGRGPGVGPRHRRALRAPVQILLAVLAGRPARHLPRLHALNVRLALRAPGGRGKPQIRGPVADEAEHHVDAVAGLRGGRRHH